MKQEAMQVPRPPQLFSNTPLEVHPSGCGMTEADVRRIVREEMERYFAELAGKLSQNTEPCTLRSEAQ